MYQFHKSRKSGVWHPMRSKRSAAATVMLLFFVAVGYTSIHMSFGITSEDTPVIEPSDPAEPTDTILVKYKSNTDSTNLQEIQTKFGKFRSRQQSEIEQLRIKVVKVPKSERNKFIQDLNSDDSVQYVEAEVPRNSDITTPNDTLYKDQWAWPKIQMDTVWDKSKGNSSTIIAVLDSGYNFAHPDLAGKTVAGYDYVNNDNDPAEDNGHGTWVGGTVAALTNNGEGVAGGCWNCKIMPLKVQDSKGSGNSTNATKAIRYAADNGAKVINMSFSGTTASQAEKDAVDYAVGKGVILFASAGNDKTDVVRYPSGFPNVISVAATDKEDLLASYSNFANTADITAPGTVTTTSFPGIDYKSVNGTSFSTPITASVAAVLVSAYPKATVAQLTKALTSTADPCCSNKIANGRVNADKAMNYLAGLFPATPPPPPSPPPTQPPPPPSPTAKTGDINGDNKVNLTDLSILLSKWNTNDSRADLNRSGKVDISDLSILLSNWTG